MLVVSASGCQVKNLPHPQPFSRREKGENLPLPPGEGWGEGKAVSRHKRFISVGSVGVPEHG